MFLVGLVLCCKGLRHWGAKGGMAEGEHQISYCCIWEGGREKGREDSSSALWEQEGRVSKGSICAKGERR